MRAEPTPRSVQCLFSGSENGSSHLKVTRRVTGIQSIGDSNIQIGVSNVLRDTATESQRTACN